MESNENATSRGDADTGLRSSRKKRRRTVLGTADTEYTLRDPYVHSLLFEHTHEYAPPSSPKTARTKAPSESDISLPTTSPHARRRMTFSTSPSGSGVDPVSSDRGALLDGEVTARLDIQTKRYASQGGPPSAMDKSRKCQSFQEPRGPKPLEVHTAARDVFSPNLQTPPDIHHSSACNEPHTPHSASFNSAIPPPKSGHACSHEPSSRPAASEGEITRIEITFEKLYSELLCSRDHEFLIQEAAQRISTSSRWLESYLAYKETLTWTRWYARAGIRKNRFMDLMNVIVEEAPKCGLGMPYTHQLRYDRYNYDGSGWSPEKYTEDGSSASESRDSEIPEQGVLPVRIANGLVSVLHG